MALHELACLVLRYQLPLNLFSQILYDLTRRRQASIHKLIYPGNQDLFFVGGEALVVERICFLSCLCQAFDPPYHSRIAIIELLCSIGIIRTLPQTYYKHCFSN
jgi:hypothetical protein